MIRKIADWAVARPMSCGVRVNLRTVRAATAAVAGPNPAPVVAWPRAGVSGGAAVVAALGMVVLWGQAAAGPPGWAVVPAGLAVRVRKTSSRVGRRSEM